MSRLDLGGVVDKQLKKIYDKIPGIECKGLCQNSCGPIIIFPAEAENIRSHGCSVPEETVVHPVNGEMTCAALDSAGRCTIHHVRPAICRLFGVVNDPKMICPYGCKPKKMLGNGFVGKRIIEELQKQKTGDVIVTFPGGNNGIDGNL